MSNIVSGTNNNGYFTALDRSFEEADVPTPSGFSQFRNTISFKFLEDLYNKQVSDWQSSCRPKYQGLYVNAIDGDKLMLPCSGDILDNKYKGIPVKDNRETYYPAMYYCCASDLITGVPVGFSQSYENNEIARASEIIESYSDAQKTLTIFDRFYFSGNLLESYKSGGYFICRGKKGSTFKEVVDFVNSSESETTAVINGVRCRLSRYTVSNTDDEKILITNLPGSFKTKTIQELYGYRWESETGNRDRTTSIKMEQFRGRTLNGVLQEVWMTLILQAVSQMACAKQIRPEQYFMKNEYIRANLKAVFNKIVDAFGLIIQGTIEVYECTKRIVLATRQKRSHYSRYYERASKEVLGKQFKRRSTIKRR